MEQRSFYSMAKDDELNYDMSNIRLKYHTPMLESFVLVLHMRQLHHFTLLDHVSSTKALIQGCQFETILADKYTFLLQKTLIDSEIVPNWQHCFNLIYPLINE